MKRIDEPAGIIRFMPSSAVVVNLDYMRTIIRAIWRLLRKHLRLPRALRITRTGWKFLGMTLVVGIAAVNTANNLLYLIFGLMLSFIMASSILSEVMLRRITVARRFPRHLFVGQAAPVTVTVRNGKRLMASFALVVEDGSTGTSSPNTAYVLKVPARDAVSVTYPLTFTRRGLHRPGNIRIVTRYPFGLFQKAATFAEYDDVLLVFPEILPLSPKSLPQGTAHVGEIVAAAKGIGVDFQGIREYVVGDSSGRIHWKSSAKLGALMTKEFHDDQRKRIAVVLDVSQSPAAVPAAFFQELEHAISLAASYATLFIQQQFQVQLVTSESRSAFADGQRHLFTLLRALALFQPTNGHGPQRLSRAFHTLERTRTSRIVIGV
jgi:uncharacterized protein (DUF58 family)